MTDTVYSSEIEEVLTMIDQMLVGLGKRELVPSSEVTDLLLDARSVLVGVKPEPVAV